MGDSILKRKTKAKCSQYLSCNVSKHHKLHSQAASRFQNIFKFCTFLPKLANIIPFFTVFFKKVIHMPLLSRIDPAVIRILEEV